MIFDSDTNIGTSIDKFEKERSEFISEYFKGYNRTPYKYEMNKAQRAWKIHLENLTKNKMEITGNIKLIAETERFTSGFLKRQLVITTNETYPQDIAIDFIKDMCIKLDSFKVGQDVKISINIRGNEYNNKYYVSLQGWKIENV